MRCTCGLGSELGAWTTLALGSEQAPHAGAKERMAAYVGPRADP